MEELKSHHDPSIQMFDSQDKESVKKMLCNQTLMMLAVVTDEIDVPHSPGETDCMQFLHDIQSSGHYKTVVITSTDQIKDKKWDASIVVLRRGTATKTAQNLLQHHKKQVTSDNLSNRVSEENRKNKRKSKSMTDKSWPFRKAGGLKSAQLKELKQHSSLDPMISDLYGKVCGIEKSLEYIRKFQQLSIIIIIAMNNLYITEERQDDALLHTQD